MRCSCFVMGVTRPSLCTHSLLILQIQYIHTLLTLLQHEQFRDKGKTFSVVQKLLGLGESLQNKKQKQPKKKKKDR